MSYVQLLSSKMQSTYPKLLAASLFPLLLIICSGVLGCQGRKGGRVSQELGEVHRRKRFNNDGRSHLLQEQRLIAYAEGC